MFCVVQKVPKPFNVKIPRYDCGVKLSAVVNHCTVNVSAFSYQFMQGTVAGNVGTKETLDSGVSKALTDVNSIRNKMNQKCLELVLV